MDLNTGDARTHLRRWGLLAARTIPGAVMVIAGLLKVGAPAASGRAVNAYQILPYDVAAHVGYGLPIVEIAAGVLLVLGLFTRTSAGIVAGLLVAFMVGIASAWARGLSIDCGCFGGGGTVQPDATAYLPDLLRDGVLLACAALTACVRQPPFSLDRALFRTGGQP